MKLSVIIPMFNEKNFICELLDKLYIALEDVAFETEIIVVDDGSTDGSSDEVLSKPRPGLVLKKMPHNSGKGAAVQYGIRSSSGEFILVQDSDLEYDPKDIVVMLTSIDEVAKEGSAIYGSRNLGARQFSSPALKRVLRIWPKQGISQWAFNYVLSLIYLAISRIWITDLLTGYKVYPKEIFNGWSPTTSGFETDHEITMRIRKLGIKIIEVPVHYYPRSKEMGKKIGPRDAIKAITTIVGLR
jgi:glycosyltransferase involved in cell wall biosynthesis